MIDFFDTKEYSAELIKRFNEGGTIWLIERTDTNEFYGGPIGPSIHVFGKGVNRRPCYWRKEIDMMVAFYGFLSKEDAERYQWLRDGTTYSPFTTPIEITEHEFVRRQDA